jgi:cysteine desulfurase
VDASQSTAKVAVDVTELGADLLTATGHKMFAPKGVAALYIRDGLPVEPAVYGGGQERGRRSGTENVAAIVGLGAAAALARDHQAADGQRLAALRDRLHRLLEESLPRRVRLNGHPTRRLPHVLNISIDGVVGQAVLDAAPDIAAATGSACHAGNPEPSPVLLAMGLPPERALAARRLSLGRWSDDEDIDRAARAIGRTAHRALQRTA